MNITGILYVVATPIGNLEDITLRALNILKEVDCIICEDSRISSKLLNHYGIKYNKLISYNNFSEHYKNQEIFKLLLSGHNCALISDAGTPLISDPGYLLVKECYEQGIKVVPVVGASAVIGALSVAGIPTMPFVFLGFLDKNLNKKRASLQEYLGEEITIVFFESPNRVIDTLKIILEVFGDNQQVVLAKELTKMFENIQEKTCAEWLVFYEDQSPRGEFVVLFRPIINKDVNIELLKQSIMQKIDDHSSSNLAKILAKEFNTTKNLVYNEILAIKNNI